MEYMNFVWLGLLILFLIIEIATVGLVTIWMAGGALAALILELMGLNICIRFGRFCWYLCFCLYVHVRLP